MFDNRRMNTLKKLIELGYDDEKKIVAVSTEQMTECCKSVAEIKDILSLQKAVKAGQLVQYLAGKEETA